MCFPSAAVFYSIESINLHVLPFQDCKGCAGCFLSATAASPLNNDPFLGAWRCRENAAPVHIFVQAPLEPDVIDLRSVFFEADFLMLSSEAPRCTFFYNASTTERLQNVISLQASEVQAKNVHGSRNKHGSH